VKMRVVMRLVAISIAMLLAIPAVVVSQLYAPTIMWIVSFGLLLSSPLIAVLGNFRQRTIMCMVFSLIINFNYLFYIPFAQPPYEMAIYGLALLLFDFAIFALIVRLAQDLKRPLGGNSTL
jgi:hypothetical protein